MCPPREVDEDGDEDAGICGLLGRLAFFSVCKTSNTMELYVARDGVCCEMLVRFVLD